MLRAFHKRERPGRCSEVLGDPGPASAQGSPDFGGVHPTILQAAPEFVSALSWAHDARDGLTLCVFGREHGGQLCHPLCVWSGGRGARASRRGCWKL